MLRKSPTLAKNRKDGPPKFKGERPPNFKGKEYGDSTCNDARLRTTAEFMALTVLDTIPEIYEWAILPGLRVEC